MLIFEGFLSNLLLSNFFFFFMSSYFFMTFPTSLTSSFISIIVVSSVSTILRYSLGLSSSESRIFDRFDFSNYSVLCFSKMKIERTNAVTMGSPSILINSVSLSADLEFLTS